MMIRKQNKARNQASEVETAVPKVKLKTKTEIYGDQNKQCEYFQTVHNKLKRYSTYSELKAECLQLAKDMHLKYPISRLAESPVTNTSLCDASVEVYPQDAPTHMVPIKI